MRSSGLTGEVLKQTELNILYKVKTTKRIALRVANRILLESDKIGHKMSGSRINTYPGSRQKRTVGTLIKKVNLSTAI